MDLNTEVRPQGILECFSGNCVLPLSSSSPPQRQFKFSIKRASGTEFPREIVARGPLIMRPITWEKRWHPLSTQKVDEATLTGAVNFGAASSRAIHCDTSREARYWAYLRDRQTDSHGLPVP